MSNKGAFVWVWRCSVTECRLQGNVRVRRRSADLLGKKLGMLKGFRATAIPYLVLVRVFQSGSACSRRFAPGRDSIS